MTVIFSGENPSVEELVALRRLREEFRALPARELKALLANKREIRLRRVLSLETHAIKALVMGEERGDVNYFSSMEAREIEERAAQLQVPFSLRSDGESGIFYMPIQYIDGEEWIALIEDDELHEAVTREMLGRGTPIIFDEEE